MAQDLSTNEPVTADAGFAEALISAPQAVLEPFARQELTVRSLVCLDIDRFGRIVGIVGRLAGGKAGTVPEAIGDPIALDLSAAGMPIDLFDLRRRLDTLCANAGGEDVLVASPDVLQAILAADTQDFPFRCVVTAAPYRDPSSGKPQRPLLQRELFDLGLVCVGRGNLAALTLRHYLASEAVTRPALLEIGTSGQITMSSLGRNGRFGNELFQYAFLKFYALRHDAQLAVPDWEGRQLFGLNDPFDAGIALPQLVFHGFTVDDLALWDQPEPPVDVDFWGYFQEIPRAWRKHRPLLRRLFDLSAHTKATIDAACARLTDNGRSTLVAIHLRRGDYRSQQIPWFRIIPAQWYRDWLEQIWPQLKNPVLYVASDEPQAALEYFADFSPRSSADLSGVAVPADLADFEVMRRADVLAMGNSSFSRMAALLAHDRQRCVLPSVAAQRFLPYEPWNDTGFWARFGPVEAELPLDALTQRSAPSPKPGAVRLAPSLNFDITDLLQHLLAHTRVSGIQRVQSEIIAGLLKAPQRAAINFTVFRDGVLAKVDPTLLENIIAALGSVNILSLRETIRAAMHQAQTYTARPGEMVLLTGAFWAVDDIGRIVQRLKHSRIVLGVLMHDILPITRPEYFQARAAYRLVKPVVDVMGLVDFVVTASFYNQRALLDFRRHRVLPPVPIEVIPFAYGLPPPSAGPTGDVDPLVAEQLGSRFVLCVGTLESRKNPAYLFNLWRLLADSGRADIPTLVFAGRRGWMVADVLEQIEATNGLDGKIVIVENLNDETLAWLYRHCLMTIFPSFEEGWGLPVGESLAAGKICLASATGGIQEIAGPLVDHIDPYNVRDGFNQLLRYLDDASLISRREAEIRENLPKRSWQHYADDLLERVLELLSRPRPFDGPAATALPADVFLPVANHPQASYSDAVGGLLSAEMACISGWGRLGPDGIGAEGLQSVLRFRPTGPGGTRINLVLKLAGSGPGAFDLKLKSGSGAEALVSLAQGGESVGMLACRSEPDGLLTVTMTPVPNVGAHGITSRGWTLRGFLYVDAGALAAGRRTQPASPRPRVDSTRRSADAASPTPPARAPIATARFRAERAPAMQRSSTLDEFLASSRASLDLAEGSVTQRHEPLFADPGDRELFVTRYRNAPTARLGAIPDRIALNRASEQFISTSRFTEGAVFDGTGVAKDLGYLLSAPEQHNPWLTRDSEGTWLDPAALTAAGRVDATCFVFYNGNLHNYYHWLVEGVLALELMTQTIGQRLPATILLPKSMDVAAMFDHRGMLKALGFDRWPIIERPPFLVQARDAFWVATEELMEDIPPHHVQKFQSRIFERYAPRRTRHGRRLFVNRLGPTRMIHNVAVVEAALQARGFETVVLEGTSVDEQIMLFQSADFIVSAHGAGLSNLVFCNPGTRVIEFMPRSEMRPFFWLISQKLGLRHAMQFCAGVERDDFQASIDVDLRKLSALFEQLEQ